MTLAAPLLQESTSEVSFSVQQTPPPSNSCGNNWPLAQMQKIKHAGSQGSRPALSVGREVGSLCGETWKILRKCLGLPPHPHLNPPPPPHTHRSLLPTELSWVPWSPNWWNSSAEAGIQDTQSFSKPPNNHPEKENMNLVAPLYVYLILNLEIF